MVDNFSLLSNLKNKSSISIPNKLFIATIGFLGFGTNNKGIVFASLNLNSLKLYFLILQTNFSIRKLIYLLNLQRTYCLLAHRLYRLHILPIGQDSILALLSRKIHTFLLHPSFFNLISLFFILTLSLSPSFKSASFIASSGRLTLYL